MPGRRIFYGWWIVFAGFVLQMLAGGLLFQAYGAYVVLIREEFGWSKTMLSAAYSLARTESGFLGPLQGWITDRFGPRAVIRLGMVVFGLGFFLFSQFRSPETFFVTFFLLAVGSSLGGWVPVGAAVVAWFRRRRALALSISSTGQAVGGLLTPLVTVSLIHLGWRWTAALSGVIVLLVGLPVSHLMRGRPELYGEVPDGRPPAPGPRTPAQEGAGRPAVAAGDFTAREALRTRAFWYISLGHGAALLAVSAVTVHLVSHVTERLGYSIQQGATVVALMTALQVVGQVAGGWMGDRLSLRWIVVGCMVGHAVAMLALSEATSFTTITGAAILHGLSWGVRGPLMSAIRADYFGGTAFATITGFSSVVVMMGSIGGPLIAGILADRTGSYVAAFRILALLAILGAVAFARARRPAPPRRA